MTDEAYSLPRIEPRPEKARCDCTACAYCGRPIVRRHEHDHMPAAKRFDGDEVVPCCLDCHDLKDRLPVDRWPSDRQKAVLLELVNSTNRAELRIYLAKMSNLVWDYGDDAKKWRELAEFYETLLREAGIEVAQVPDAA